MKLTSVIFISLFALTSQVQAVYIPGSDKTPIYFCYNDENHQARISRDHQSHSTMVAIEEVMKDHSTQQIFEEKVSEFSNSSHTVFAGENLMIKIRHDPSGNLPGTMLISNDNLATKSNINCQVVYKILH